MSIKHGNKMLRQQQSDLREKVRWSKIQLEEANEEIARLKVIISDLNKKVSFRNMQISGEHAKNRKLLSLMNEAVEMNVFGFTAEFMASKHNLEACESLRDRFVTTLKEKAE